MFVDFTYGVRFRIGDIEYEVLRNKDQDELEVYNLSYERKELLSYKEVLNAYNERGEGSNRLFFMGNSNSIEYGFNDYSVAEIDLMNKRFSVIEPFIEGELRPAMVNEYLKNYPDSEKPNGSLSTASFYRWINLWNKRQYKLDLIPQKTGPKDHRVASDVIQEATRIILKYGKQVETLTIRDQFNYFENVLKDTNKTREEGNKLKDFSESTFRRLQKKHVDSYERDKEILGRSQADLKHNGVRSTIRATRPLEVLELDWTPVDCLIVDFHLNEAYRPVVMYGIDQATNEPMGSHIIFKEEPNADDWKQLILNCMLPKTKIKERFPRVQKEWTAYGVPQSILLDNASVNDCKEVAEVCSMLKIGLRYAEVKSGHQKGAIEQALGNLNNKAFHGLVGTLFSNPKEKGEYNARAKATVDIKGLHHIVNIVIVDLIANNFNRGENVKGVPEIVWQESLRRMKVHPRLPYRREYLELIFSSGGVTRTIVPRGIELKGHFFFSEELNELRRRLQREGKSRAVQVRYGSDMRVIYVRDEKNKQYIEAYLKNGGLEKKGIDRDFPVHAELLDYLTNQDNKNFNEFDKTHLGAARREIEEIQEECKKEFRSVKRSQKRQRATEETIASAISGVPSELIPGIADTIIISNVTDQEDNSSVTGRVKSSKTIINAPKPGQLYVDNIDLESLAAQWGTSQKEV
ncbi:hypothetical protein PMSD_21200 [Paenibacillus macquariensis subsp. defensor]|nr:hypothetical protein PMSD_21200 [Paenibacillus macquariensis subsp. defensor]